MKRLVAIPMLVLVASMVMGGAISGAAAQNDPQILLKLANRAQEQIQSQISDDSSDKAKELFEKGVEHVSALEKSLEEENVKEAQKHFLSAMRTFKEVSKLLIEKSSETQTTQLRTTQTRNIVNLDRLYTHIQNLKTLAQKHNASVDFTELEQLFTTAKDQINNEQYDDLKNTIQEIKRISKEISKEIRESASKQTSDRAKQYAQQYIEQIDRLIENAKDQRISEDIIKKLQVAKERLASATTTQDIIKEIKEIILIKKQFELTQNDKLESKVISLEKTLIRLSQTDKANPEEISEARELLNECKKQLQEGNLNEAEKLLRALNSHLRNITNSLS